MHFPLLAACTAAPAAEKRRRRGPSTGATATAGTGADGCGGAALGCDAADAAGGGGGTAGAEVDVHCGGGCIAGGDASSSSSGTCRFVATILQISRVFGMALRQLPGILGAGAVPRLPASACRRQSARWDSQIQASPCVPGTSSVAESSPHPVSKPGVCAVQC